VGRQATACLAGQYDRTPARVGAYAVLQRRSSAAALRNETWKCIPQRTARRVLASLQSQQALSLQRQRSKQSIKNLCHQHDLPL